jgi:DNA-binding Lrp family transcriptional regulator
VEELLARARRLSAGEVIRSLHTFVNVQKTGPERSTLVAMRVPPGRIGRTVSIINEYPSVTHNYGRDHFYNLWFTVSERDEQALLRTLEEIKRRTGVPDSAVLDLRTVRVFKVDVHFNLTGRGTAAAQKTLQPDHPPLDGTDHLLLRLTQEGIPLVEDPFREIAGRAGVSEDEAVSRLERLYRAGIIKRIGVSLNQRKLGIVANALVAWKIPKDALDGAGKKLSSEKEVTHCYERSIVPGVWEYNVFTVLHGRDHRSVEEMVSRLAGTISHRGYAILFSTEQFKRTSMVHRIGGNTSGQEEACQRTEKESMS